LYDAVVLANSRGEAYVLVQFILLALIFFLPDTHFLRFQSTILGTILKFTGWALLLWAGFSLGKNLTPLPKPKENASLITSGAFAWMRHPIYTALMLLTFGGSLERGHGLGLILALCLAVLLKFKSRREEQWLLEQFSDYAVYKTRVKKFIPKVL
jgi:protein-S-isoprenylcysteine O-methyltransferase Ste14